MNSYLTKLIKSNHTEWKEMNQIKSNKSQEKTYTTWVWLLWKSYKVNSILFINNTLFWFRSNIFRNESSRLTFWIRFGISNYNPYSLFRSTYQCHQNKDNRNSILQNWKWMLDLANPHSIISIHINHYFSCQRTWIIIIPHLSPLPYSIRYHKPRISSFWFLL